MTSPPRKIRITRPDKLPVWKDRSRHVPPGEYVCADGGKDTYILNADDGATYRVEVLEYEHAVQRGDAEEVLTRRPFVSKKMRTVRPDPATNPKAEEYQVVDVEQNPPRKGREYHAGTITLADGAYFAVQVQLAEENRGRTAQMNHATFTTIQAAVDWLPEGVVPFTKS